MKNKIIRFVRGEEHILYEISAEIFLVLDKSKLFHETFQGVANYRELVIESLSHTRSEAERTKVAAHLMRELWRAQIRFSPYLPANLLATFEYERLFYPRYRDHTVHQLRVLLLGLYLYSRNDILRDSMRMELATISPLASGSTEKLDTLFIKTWVVSALFHDQGYLFELSVPNDAPHLAKVFGSINAFLATPISLSIRDLWGVELSSIKERRLRIGLSLPQAYSADSFDDLLFDADGSTTILSEIEDLANAHNMGPLGQSLARYFEMARTEKAIGRSSSFIDHGIASAVMLLRVHKELERYLTQLQSRTTEDAFPRIVQSRDVATAVDLFAQEVQEASLLVRHAAAAIAVHNVDKKAFAPAVYAGPRYSLNLEEFRVDLGRSPLAFFLMLADTLQEWDRPRFVLPEDSTDHIRLDQHMLLSADSRKVYVSIFSPHTGLMDAAPFEKLQRHLGGLFGEVETKAILGSNAAITYPNDLSSESVDQARHRERLKGQELYERLSTQWNLYRERLRAEDHPSNSDSDRRSRHIRRLGAFLEWCETNSYDPLQPSPDKPTESIYAIVRAEIHNLNYVIAGSIVRDRALLAPVGSGGYGTVWKAQGRADGSMMEALKIFHTTNFSQLELLSRFHRGYQSMRKLEHPQITRVNEFTMIPRGYFLEFVDGPNLKDFLQQKSTRKREMKEIGARLELMIEITQILDYAHGEGVVHRDIKPENVLMRWSQSKNRTEPVLTDFDLAWFIHAAPVTSGTNEVGGSIWYCAPEQKKLREDPELVHRPTVDIFSLGRLLYFVLTASHPEEGIDLAAELSRHLDYSYEIESASFKHIIVGIFRKATDIHPEQRYANVLQLKEELTQLKTLLGMHQGELTIKSFMLELSLRCDSSQNLSICESGAKDGKLELAITGGASISLVQSTDYLEFTFRVLDDLYFSKINKAFEVARGMLNEKIEAILEKSGFLWRNMRRGAGTDLYLFTARLTIDKFDMRSLRKLEKCLMSIRLM